MGRFIGSTMDYREIYRIWAGLREVLYGLSWIMGNFIGTHVDFMGVFIGSRLD